MIELVEGDILDAQEKYICHQCNCVSRGAAGLADSLFERFPYANIYAQRKEHSKIGTIHVAGNGKDQRYVVNMFAQYYPSFLQREAGGLDSTQNRQRYFNSCLLALLEIPNLTSVAFPYRVGCGLARGNWEAYLSAIKEFAKRLQGKQEDARVVIYRKP